MKIFQIIMTLSILILGFEIFDSFFGKTNEKYINPLMINKALIKAIRDKNLKLIDKYLSYKKTDLKLETLKGNTALIESLITNLNSKYLLKIIKKSDINHVNKNSLRPIHFAIMNKDIEQIKTLISRNDFNENALFNGKNLIEFTSALKISETIIKNKLMFLNIINLFSYQFPKLNPKKNNNKIIK